MKYATCRNYYLFFSASIGDMSHIKKSKKTYTPTVRFDRNIAGKMVLRLRAAQGISRAQFVVRAQVSGWGISYYALRRIEMGEREVTDIELKKLARILHVPVAQLLK